MLSKVGSLNVDSGLFVEAFRAKKNIKNVLRENGFDGTGHASLRQEGTSTVNLEQRESWGQNKAKSKYENVA